jgi:hypothetical protein
MKMIRRKLVERVLVIAVLALCFVSRSPGEEIRARADDPSKADTEGYSVLLLDTGNEGLLVQAAVAIPASFGKVEKNQLVMRNEDGRHLCSVETVMGTFPAGTEFEFNIRRELLKNSVLHVWGAKNERGRKSAKMILGTFAVTDYEKAKESGKIRSVRLAIAEFGRFDGIFTDDFTETDKILLEEGNAYKFRLFIRGDGRSLPLRVELELPSPPETWGEFVREDGWSISTDGRTASKSGVVPTDKLFENLFGVAAGDPAGKYQIRLFVQEQLVKTFNFRVQRE